jgi:hypothetical protein
MVANVLTVVRGDHQQRVVQDSTPTEHINQLTDLLIYVVEFAVVEGGEDFKILRIHFDFAHHVTMRVLVHPPSLYYPVAQVVVGEGFMKGGGQVWVAIMDVQEERDIGVPATVQPAVNGLIDPAAESPALDGYEVEKSSVEERAPPDDPGHPIPGPYDSRELLKAAHEAKSSRDPEAAGEADRLITLLVQHFGYGR